MIEKDKNQVFCRNGHPQPTTNSRFCIFCGTPLLVQPDNPPPTPQAPQTPPQDFQPPPTIVQSANQPLQPAMNPGQQFNPNNPGQFQQNQPPNQTPPYPSNNAQVYQNIQMSPVPPKICGTCGGKGKLLAEKILVCRECKWLRQLAPGYGIAPEAFQWAEDGKAMATLRSIKPLKMAAEAVSEKVGRRWIETTFNGVLLSERQLPHVYFQAVRAAQIMGLERMPDVYVSGNLMWDCRTYGSDTDSFVIIGSILATNFAVPSFSFSSPAKWDIAEPDMHFENGDSVFAGEQGQRRGMMRGGLFSNSKIFSNCTHRRNDRDPLDGLGAAI